ncbi:PotD/PotF family extracellular solute-binding protein [Herbiconiux sp. VKM Ac-2851]|uniref:ABC transporter substrate-binding protein n=1 Tax=Herbiconiux sp. VKM Ac-2851 TaxID=2739025 RepID=UPI0015663D3B|nr:spermidine/putrescine ABC transporter substrate-binding protein [Herbiconiux sp. VKM Ac-2851]NQX33333.1 spermidine/putrescine ABC transporter substrate-binding protein [Herbiconiux sp. VKM Ac-2851]
MNKKVLALGALTLASATVLAGCSAGGDASSSGAAGDGSLSIYAWAGEIPDSVIAGFEKETGITVTVDTFDSNETMISKLAAGNSGYDVVEPSQYAVQLMVERDLVAPIDQSKLEGFDNLAEKFVDPSFDPGNKHSIPWAWGTTGILYNEACTGAPVTGWKDMWNPAYSGKVYMLDNMLSAYIAGLQVNGLSATTTDEADIETATDSLLEQKSLLGGYNSTNYADLVGTGDACIAEAYSGTTSATAVENNPDVKYIIPEEGGTLWTDSFSIVKGTANEDAAYQWLNYTLRPEVAALVTDDASLASTNEAALPLVADQSQVENPAIYAPADSLTNSEFIVDPGDALAFFQDGWTRVRAS